MDAVFFVAQYILMCVDARKQISLSSAQQVWWLLITQPQLIVRVCLSWYSPGEIPPNRSARHA